MRVRRLPIPSVDLAAEALARATSFLREQADLSWLAQPWPDRSRAVRSRLIGNWLGELDRLLHVLLDAGASDAGKGVSPSMRNTILKLAAHSDGKSWCRPHLLGLSTARVAFRYTQGRALRPDDRGGMVATLGWLARDGAWAQAGIGQHIRFDDHALREVCGFYEQLSQLLAAEKR